MKKILMVLVLLLAIALAAVYLFIPGKIKIESTVSLKAALPGVSRSLMDENTWKKLWPGETPLKYHEQTYSIKGKLFSVFDIGIYSGNDTINSRLQLLAVENDSMAISWRAHQVTSNNPFTRFSRYRQAKANEKNMNKILQSIKDFFEKTKNIYGIEIKQTLVTDSVLISVRRSFEHYPTVPEIDEMIQDLKKYIVQNNAVEKNAPMLNIFRIDSSKYEAMSAIPIDKALPPTNGFVTKFLLKGGNILEAEIRGGPYTIDNGLKELDNYRSDHKFSSPAIPFQLLVTDRARETDTTKWVTKIYCPIY